MKYLVMNVLDTCDNEGYPLYWSNSHGWVPLKDATWFGANEFIHLPMDGKWVEVKTPEDYVAVKSNS